MSSSFVTYLFTFKLIFFLSLLLFSKIEIVSTLSSQNCHQNTKFVYSKTVFIGIVWEYISFGSHAFAVQRRIQDVPY